MTHREIRLGHMVLGQRVEPVKIVCCLGMWTTLALLSGPTPPSHHLKCCPEWCPVLQAWVVAYMFLNCPHLAIAVARGSGKEACEVGNRVGIDNPASRTLAQRLRIRRLQEAGGGPGEFMSCQVASGRSFRCARTHEVLISVCIEWGSQR